MTTVCYFLAEEDGVCRISHSRGGYGGAPPHPMIFFENPPSKLMLLPWGAPPPPPLKSEAPLI